MEQKKYASLESLQIFKENSDKLYATQESIYELSNTLDEKANAGHIHAIADVTNLSSTLSEINDSISQKAQVQMITSDVSELLSTLKIHKMTQEEYDLLLENGMLEDNAVYLTPDEEIDLSDYATIEQLNEKANSSHNHDNMYYTEAEMDNLLNNKSDSNHNHDNAYDAKGAADEAIINAQTYTDNAVNDINNRLLNKSDTDHAHNDMYYTKTEMDGKVATINSSVSTSLNEAKAYSDIGLNTAKTYTDNAVAQRTQVQIITWEDSD